MPISGRANPAASSPAKRRSKVQMRGVKPAHDAEANVMAGLDPAICRLHGLSTIVIPANAGIQLHFAQHR